VLKPAPKPSGHLSVVLGRDGGTRDVHRIVLDAFVGPRPDGMECRHLDDDPTNNALSNLVWGTRSENQLDAVRNGRKAVGSAVHSAGHSEAQILRAVSLVSEGHTIKSAAEITGSKAKVISEVIRGRQWKHLDLSNFEFPQRRGSGAKKEVEQHAA
jgi:hypothetical protein